MISTAPVGNTKPWDTVTKSTGYMFWYPCTQSTGNAEDRAGTNDGTKTVSDAVLWANAGYMSFRTQSTANETVAASASAFDFDFYNGESLLLSFWFEKAANEQWHMPFHNANSNGENGIKFQTVGTDGKYQIGFYSGNTNFLTSKISTALSDGTMRHVAIAIDGATETLDVYINGTLDGTIQAVDISTWKTQGGATATQGSESFLIGGPTNATAECKIRDVHALKRTGGLPTNMQEIVNKLYSRPFYPLTSNEF